MKASALRPPEPQHAPGEEMIQTAMLSGLHAVEPAQQRDQGQGPFSRLVLRGATIIDGSGGPPWGPADIVVEKGRIASIVSVGSAGQPIRAERRPAAGDHEIDCHSKYVTPGFIDCHAHIGIFYHAAAGPMAPADYVYKLWLAHGVTTVREMGCFNGLAWTIDQKKKSEGHEIVAPRLLAYPYFPAVTDFVKVIHTPAEARTWLSQVKERGADGIKFFGAPPSIMQAALEECAKLGLRSGCHHSQQAVARMNTLRTAGWGLTSQEHYYGIPESLFEGQALQDYPSDYNYTDEYHRFSQAASGFQLAAPPGSSKWTEVLHRFRELDFTIVPTLAIYDANRDQMRARRAEWHDDYTWAGLQSYFEPSRGGHGSYWYRWSTTNEIQWKSQYKRWMEFLNDYKNLGGRVCAGSDSGFVYQVYGFGFIRELELLQEAGFSPLEVLTAATLKGAELVGMEDEIGTVEVGKCADLLVHDSNPLADFKLLYGCGAVRLDESTNSPARERALRYTICGGVVYDVDELLADVRAMVVASKKAAELAGHT
ncbi:amidohydrolase family protein [Ottowia thiooxydans]|uniref:Amidohydrolase-related domain-containing protein n=1 Tax=Ottowia thiooxydans TaxID=219182 RepID=A0ABV2QFP4_9BURK